ACQWGVNTLPTPRPPNCTLCPYTSLFRSACAKSVQGRGSESRANPELRRNGRDDPAIGAVRVTANVPARQADNAAYQRRGSGPRSEEHTSELQSREKLVCRLLLAKKRTNS